MSAAATRSEERRIVVASSLSTIFEWYDFYLYAALAPFFAGLFFPSGNATAALLAIFAVYAAGFLVRPLGALVFRRAGARVGREHAALVSILLLGLTSFAVGLLPTYEVCGALSPILLVTLRLLHGLAIGGEHGRAAIELAERAPNDRRGYATSWIQATAIVGFVLTLLVVGGLRAAMHEEAFARWGWRVPFWSALALLASSIYVRLERSGTPRGGGAPSRPRGERPLEPAGRRYVLLALFGAVAGQAVVWYTGQFYVMSFLTVTLKVNHQTTYILLAAALVIGAPFFILFGKLSDKIGRLKIILAGCLIAALTYVPLFRALTHYVNPALEAFHARTPISVTASDCNAHWFVLPSTRLSDCDRARDFLTRSGLSFDSRHAPAGSGVVTTIGATTLRGWDEARYVEALRASGAPAAADGARINHAMALLILVILVLYVGMVCGPLAAFLVELFPATIRHTAMPLPSHLGNGWFGGILPLLATATVAASGDIYGGLWYPVGVAVTTVVVGAIMLREAPRAFDIRA